MDYGEMLKFSINGFRNGETLKLGAWYFAMFAVFYIVVFLLTGMTGSELGNKGNAGSLLLYFTLLIIVSLLSLPLGMKIAGNAMREAKVPPHNDVAAPYFSGTTAILTLRFVAQLILWGIYWAFSVKQPKFLLLLLAAVAGFALMAVSAASGNALLALGGLAIFGLASIAYMFVLIYNCVRLAFVEYAFLQTPHSSLRGNLSVIWEGTRGKFWNIFVALVAIVILTFVALIPLVIFYVIAMLLSPLFAEFVNALWSVFIMVFSSYALAYVFADIAGGKKAPASAGPGKKKAA